MSEDRTFEGMFSLREIGTLLSNEILRRNDITGRWSSDQRIETRLVQGDGQPEVEHMRVYVTLRRRLDE